MQLGAKRFPFGAVYLIEQGRGFDVIERDLRLIRDTGFDLVTLWPAANAWLAKSPQGFVFDDTIRVLDVCGELGIRAIIQLIGQNQAQEFMPDCLLSEEMYACDESGNIPNCYWANPNHPEVAKAIERYLEASVNALKGRPAVWAWDAFNEAHLKTDDAWTTRLYHQWLEKKYGNIGELNRRWHRRFASFDQINPRDRRVAYSVWSSLLPAVDYERFRADNLTDICRSWAEIIRAADSTHPVLVDGTTAQILASSVTGRNCDEFAQACVCDIFGGTFYPKSWGRNLTNLPWELALYFAVPAAAARKADKPFIVSELQTHTQSALTPGSEVAPEELCCWIWIGISSGAKAFQLWRWRPFLHGFQATGRGLTGIDGSPNERAEAVKDLVAQLRPHEERIASAAPVAPAATLVVSYRNHLYHDSFNHFRGNRYGDCIKGWYRALWRSGIPTGITELEMLDERDSPAPVLILPSCLSVSAGEAAKLRRYVESGGCLIAEARMGTLDEWGEVPPENIPGSALGEVFGFTERDVGGPSKFVLDGETGPASFLTQHITPHAGTEVLASLENGEPALVRHDFGKGSTLYAAFFLGLALGEAAHEKARKLVVDEVLAMAPESLWAEKDENVHVAFHERGETKLAYVVNTCPKNQRAAVRNTGRQNSGIDLLNGEKVELADVRLGGYQARLVSF